MMRRTVYLLVVLFVATFTLAADNKTEKPLTNADVIELSNAKLGDDLIIAKVNQAPTEQFDVSTDALVALKKAGVSNAVLDAMIKRASHRAGENGKTNSTASATNDGQSGKPKVSREAVGQACSQNFTMEGSFLKGRTYKTWASLGKIDRNAAFDRAAQFIASDGWRIATSSRDTGIVSATQDVSWSDGKTAPLSTVLKETADDLIVQVSFSTPAGTASPKDAVIKALCGIATAAAAE